MPTLPNAKHERFAQALAGGASQIEAYALAGYKAHRGNASSLAQSKNILERVAKLLAERETIHSQGVAKAIEQTAATEEWIINKLIQNVERASTAEPVLDSKGNRTGEYRYDGAVVNRSLELLGKQRGMFIDRKEVGRPGDFKDLNDDQLRDLVNREAAELGIRGIRVEASRGSSRPVSKPH